MRLSNMGAKSNGYNYRVVLDTDKVTTNYIERARGVRFDEKESRHYCETCNKEVGWNQTWANPNFTTEDCSCGQHATLLIIPFPSVSERRYP